LRLGRGGLNVSGNGSALCRVLLGHEGHVPTFLALDLAAHARHRPARAPWTPHRSAARAHRLPPAPRCSVAAASSRPRKSEGVPRPPRSPRPIGTSTYDPSEVRKTLELWPRAISRRSSD